MFTMPSGDARAGLSNVPSVDPEDEYEYEYDSDETEVSQSPPGVCE